MAEESIPESPGPIMASGDRTSLAQANGPGSVPLARPATPARRWPAKRLITALAVVVTGGLLTLWLTGRGRQDPVRVWADAERAFLAGRWDRARESLKLLEKLRAKTGLDWMLEAQLATAEGRPDAALDAIDHIPDEQPIAAQAHLLAGRIERQRRRIRKAEAEFRRALAIKPGLIDAHKELIYILGIQSRRSEVDAEFHALGRLTTLSHHDLFTWALTHFTHWNPEIVQDLEGFINADPDDRYSRLALVELLLGQPDAETTIARILEPLPDSDPDALALRISLALNRGRFEEAERLLVRAPSDHPRISRIRGELSLRRGDLDAAIQHFRQALSAEPYDRVSPMQLAQTLRLKGDVATAEAYADRVRKLNRLYSLIIRVRSPSRENQLADLAELGKACEDVGLGDEAIGWYGRAITVNPLDVPAQQGLHRLGRSIGGSRPSGGLPRP
jgi:tetratricopeptide (TPR) repeat protein